MPREHKRHEKGLYRRKIRHTANRGMKHDI